MLKKIRLELARTPDRPDGDPDVAYEIVAPLDSSGHLDAEGWRAHRADCRVAHFRPGRPVETGVLLHRPGGAWAISYRPGEEDNEALFKLDRHLLKPGEYVSIAGHDGAALPYKVASVETV
ncbi:MAG: hypothetical protein ACK4NA_15185 [Alphaproteobacteria bacterium]